MNFTFTDLGNSILNMIQSESPKNLKLNSGQSDSKEQLFEKKLGKILEKGQRPEEQNVSEVMAEPASERAGEFVSFLEEKLGDKKGNEFLTELKNIFLSISNGNLENISIDAQGLETLKQMLAGAGFNAEDLDDLFAELIEGLEGRDLNLDELFNQLFELPADALADQAAEPQVFLETSSLPYLESILTALDIPSDTVQQILSAADHGEKGINLDVIIEQLQDVQKKAFYSNTQFQAQEGKEQIQALLKPFGIEADPSKDFKLTLNDLVETFEALRKGFKNQATSDHLTTDIQNSTANIQNKTDSLKDLFKGLEIKNLPKEKSVFDFSSAQIKDQFKNQLLESETTPANLKGLFSKGKGKSLQDQPLIKVGLKEFVSSLEEKISQHTVLKDQVADGKTLGEKIKGQLNSLNDQTQLTASDAKTSDNQSAQIVSKARSGFRNLPAFVTQQVSKSIVRAVNQGESTLRIQLKPPELGRLMLTIDNNGNNMKVNIVTENAAAREILVSNASELRTVLSNSGVNLERFDVDMNSDFRQSMADARGQAGNSNKRHQNRQNQTVDPVTGDMITDAANLMEAIDQGQSLHFVA